jgi:hypothetical protein
MVKRELARGVKGRLNGETEMDETDGLVTVRLVLPTTVPNVAETVAGLNVVERAFSQARFPPGVVTVAMEGSDVDHATAPVMSRELPLLKEPVAAMRTRVLLTRDTLAGERATPERVAGDITIPVRFPPVTLRLDVPLTPFRVALIVVVPCKRVVAAPLLATIVAIPGMDEVQVTWLVMSAVDPSV